MCFFLFFLIGDNLCRSVRGRGVESSCLILFLCVCVLVDGCSFSQTMKTLPKQVNLLTATPAASHISRIDKFSAVKKRCAGGGGWTRPSASPEDLHSHWFQMKGTDSHISRQRCHKEKERVRLINLANIVIVKVHLK